MGNSPVKLVVRVDGRPPFVSGTLLTGRVYLSVNESFVDASSLTLRFQGREYSTIIRDDRETTERFTADHTLVSREFELAFFPSGRVERGQYEFPFQWQLPDQLPSTMKCGSRSQCEVKYQLTCMLQRNGIFSFANGYQHAIPVIIACRPSGMMSSPIHLDPEVVPIRSCCRRRGNMELGIDSSTNLATPSARVDVGVTGKNESSIEVAHIRIQWIEITRWNVASRKEKVKKVLCDKKIRTDNLRNWAAINKVQQYLHFIQLKEAARIQTQLFIPRDANDTYQGTIMSVEHFLEVTVVTPGACCVTSPQCTYPVVIQRAVAQGAAVVDAVVTPAPASSSMVLPHDWLPTEAEVVVLPDSSEYNGTAPVATARAINDVAPSAPPEQAAFSMASLPPTAPEASGVASLFPSPPEGEGDIDPTSVASIDDLQRLLRKNQGNPIHALDCCLLSNAKLGSDIANMTPPRFLATVQCVSSDQQGSFARKLARTMGPRFSYRHVLNAVWILPSPMKMEVVTMIAPLASDINKGRQMIEEELTGNDLRLFKAALKQDRK